MDWLFRLLAAIALVLAPAAGCAALPQAPAPQHAMHHAPEKAPCHRPDADRPCAMTSCCAITPEPQMPVTAVLPLPAARPRIAALHAPPVHQPPIDLPPPRAA